MGELQVVQGSAVMLRQAAMGEPALKCNINENNQRRQFC
jgi:hypothetical protein